MGAAMYANAQAAGGSEESASSDETPGSSNDDDVVDAEIVDEDRPQDKTEDK
jgi:molecular chaperone DnaK